MAIGFESSRNQNKKFIITVPWKLHTTKIPCNFYKLIGKKMHVCSGLNCTNLRLSDKQ